MQTRLPLLLSAGALIALGAPASAMATDYCVPTAAACPGGVGTAKPTLQIALDLADDATDADRVFLASGTFTAPTIAGFGYNGPSAPVQIIGAGSSGAQKTVLTAPDAAVATLSLKAGPGSSLSGVEVAIPDNTALNSFQVPLGNVDAGDVAVTSGATQTGVFFGLELKAGSSFHDGSINVSPTYGRAINVSGPGVSIRRSTILGRGGVGATQSAVSLTIDRVVFLAGNSGAVNVAGSVATVTNSLVLQAGTGCALSTIDQGTDGVLNGDGLTLVGTSGTSAGVCASSIFDAPRRSVVNLTNSIISGMANDRQVFSSSTGSAEVNVSWSDFDPAKDAVVGTGPTVLTPAKNTLGATNVNVDPQFVSGGYALSAASPVRDIGDPGAAGGLDLLGAPRLCGPRDLGAYELDTSACAPVAGGGGGGGGGAGGGGSDPGIPSQTPEPGPTGDSPTPVPSSPPARPDTTAPVLSKLGFSHRSFTIQRGSRVRFSVSEAAAVTVLLQQRTTKGKRVVYRTRARLRRDALAGANAVSVRGLIGQVLLKPGRYRARVTAVDAAGNASTPRTIVFRVLAP